MTWNRVGVAVLLLTAILWIAARLLERRALRRESERIYQEWRQQASKRT